MSAVKLFLAALSPLDGRTDFDVTCPLRFSLAVPTGNPGVDEAFLFFADGAFKTRLHDGTESSLGGTVAGLSIASGKTFTVSNTLTLAGTDGSTLNIGGGGTLGSNAFTSTAYVPSSRTVNGQALSGDVAVTTISGNAATATALQTARTINGVSFDGTASITVTAAAGTLTGTSLASGVTASSLTSVGTLTGGATGVGFTIALDASTVTGTLNSARLPASGATAGSYTNANITIDAKGRVTSASNGTGGTGSTIALTGPSWVDTGGDDGTGAVGDPAHPFATNAGAWAAGAQFQILGLGSFPGVSGTDGMNLSFWGMGNDNTDVTSISADSADTSAHFHLNDLGGKTVSFGTISYNGLAADVNGGTITARGVLASAIDAKGNNGGTASNGGFVNCYDSEVNLVTATPDAGGPGGNGGSVAVFNSTLGGANVSAVGLTGNGGSISGAFSTINGVNISHGASGAAGTISGAFLNIEEVTGTATVTASESRIGSTVYLGNFAGSTVRLGDGASATKLRMMHGSGGFYGDLSLGSLTANRAWTLPNVSGALVSTGDTGTVTNTMLAGSIANAKLANSAMTIAGTSVSLGGAITLDGITGLASAGIVYRSGANALGVVTIGSGLTYSAGNLSLTTSPKLIQAVHAATAATGSTTTAIPNDDTIPQITEGAEALTVTITPTSTANKIRITGCLQVARSAGNMVVAALFRDSGPDALAVFLIESGAVTQPATLQIDFTETAPSTSSITYRVRYGAGSGTCHLNQSSSGRVYGGALISKLTAEEIA